MDKQEITLTGTIQAEIYLTGRLIPRSDEDVVEYATEQDIINIFNQQEEQS